LRAALDDPVAFATFGPTPRAFDEIQRAGDPIIRAIKLAVDDDQRPGQFLLNGSANFLTVPTISESLAGRMALFDLWPFSQGELDRTPDGFVRRALTDPESVKAGAAATLRNADYLERLCLGGFPEVVDLSERARAAWFTNYIRTVTERDIVELTGARKAQHLPRILALLAARSANELVVSHIHDAGGLASRDTTDDYVAFLQMSFLVHLLPAWSRKLTKKVSRHPKVHLVDTGLAAHILGKNATALARPTDPARGPLLESFVVNEIMKQLSWHDVDVRAHHFREHDGAEVDLVLETPDGHIVGIEVKSSSVASSSDAKWLAWLRDKVGDDFIHGFVLHTGERSFALGDRLTAAPISALWTTP